VKRLLLFASKLGYQIRQFEQAARRIGADVALATDRCGRMDDPWGDHAIAVKFEKIAQSVEALKGLAIDGVAAVGDKPALLAAEAAEAFGLPFHSPGGARAALDKSLARSTLAGKLRIPRSYTVDTAEFPCVVKPLGQSASRGVMRANDRAELDAALERLRKMREERVLVEGYIPGREYAVEGIATDGEFRALAIFDKPDPLEGPYFEETIYTTPSRAPEAVQRELVETAAEAARLLGLRHGPVHAELRHNEEGAWILEAHARPIGGLCSKAVRFLGGMPLEEYLVRHALGEDVSGLEREGRASGVMMIPIPHGGLYQSVEGEERARVVPGIEEVIVTAKEGQLLLPLPEGSTYMGFIFARADTPAEVEAALRESHGELRFEIATVLRTFSPSL
jgi:predicted ATP-grasp superfamily ATP-dependent carboligase